MDVFKSWPIYRIQPVQWGNMDAMGHVNNVTYIRWLEDARIELFEKADLFPSKLDISGKGPILGKVDCRYRIPLEYPDVIESLCGIREIRDHDFIVDHVILSQKHQAVAATGSSRIVMYDYSAATKAPIDSNFREKLQAWLLPKNGV